MSSSLANALSGRQRWQAFAVCVSVAALTILDLSKVNVALPSIEKSLGAGPAELQIIVAGYALAFGLALVPAGRLGDLHSRKTMFVVGLSLFMVSSLACAIAPNIEFLMVARIVQGIAAGIQMPQVIGLTQQLFQGEERGRAFGLFGATIGVSTAFGPTLGGLLIAVGGPTDGWRYIFAMNVPLVLILLPFALKLLPARQERSPGSRELDLVGILILAVATFSVMLPFVLTTGGPDDQPARWYLLILAAIAAASFVLWERRYKRIGKSPVVHFDLFRKGSYRNGLLIAMAYFAAMPAMFLLTTLFLQQGIGLEPVFAGMVSIPFALSSAVTAWYGGTIVNRVGRKLVVLGIVIVLVGFSLVLLAAELLPADVAIYGMGVGMLVAGTGGGFVISPNQTLTLAEVPVEQGGVAGSMAQLGQRVGTAMGTAAASAAFYATIYSETGSAEKLDVFHDAFRAGFAVTLSLIVVALVLGFLDLGARKRRKRSAQTA